MLLPEFCAHVLSEYTLAYLEGADYRTGEYGLTYERYSELPDEELRKMFDKAQTKLGDRETQLSLLGAPWEELVDCYVTDRVLCPYILEQRGH